jgi:hypothetical protein
LSKFAAFVFLLLFFVGHACGGEIRQASVQYADGVYHVEFDALVYAGQPEIYTLLTDYNHLYRLNDTIKESAVISEQGKLARKYRMRLQSCILFFCRSVVMVEDVVENGQDQVTTTIDPAQSDFSTGQSTWSILPAGTGLTSIRLSRNLVPAFWVPPVIGPWAIKRKMTDELVVLLERLELYAGKGSKP